MEYEIWLTQLSELLVSYGVPAEQGQMAAFGLVFLTATLVVLLFVLLLFRIGGGRRVEDASSTDEASAVEESVERAPVDEPAEPEAAELVEGEAVPATESVDTVDAAAAPVAVVEAPPAIEEPVEALDEAGLFGRLRQGLAKTRTSFVGRVDALLGSHGRFDDEFIEEFEEILITADFGMQATQDVVEALSSRLKKAESQDLGRIHELLKEEIRIRLQQAEKTWTEPSEGPLVVMVVGVNGVGKTTTIGKLAKQYTEQGKSVVLGAGDTFRAAAAEQLEVWGERSGAEVIRQSEGTDPGAVAFDAAKAAVARQADVLIVDTAGRLHTKVNLMEELKKVRRVLDREIPGAPHETLLVLDATTGQNAMVQAKMFKEAVEVTGIALTKLDGTAKGGIVVAIGSQLALPVRFIGVGEGVHDLRPFDAEEFVAALFESP
jgi:fused signal recognition particle receptor